MSSSQYSVNQTSVFPSQRVVASESYGGITQMATAAQVAAGTRKDRAVSPYQLANADLPIQNISGDLTVSGDLILDGAAKQLQVNGGAVTDFIGTGTLASGTVTIANTNIAAGDRIFLQRIAANASTTLGELSYSISAATSFTVTSLILGTPGSTQTGDTSTFSYFIVRQV